MTTRPRKPAPGTPAPGKLALPELAQLKARRQPIAMVTAYDAPSGRLADAAGADLILVGDSAAMTVLGHDSTVPATMEEMLILTRAVLTAEPRVVPDYVEVARWNGHTVLAAAVRAGSTRLIDNVLLEGSWNT